MEATSFFETGANPTANTAPANDGVLDFALDGMEMSDPLGLVFETASSENERMFGYHTGKDELLSDMTAEPLAKQVHFDTSLRDEAQSLRERIHILEQRVFQPTDREQDLEMVLGNVWQALVRSGSTDAQPDSPVWRLVARFASNVLSTTPGPRVTSSQQLCTRSADTSEPLSTVDWTAWLNDADYREACKSLASDSGYSSSLNMRV